MAILLDEVITPITVATAALAPLSSRVLWGNVASAVNGAARQVAAARPELATAAWAAAASFFRDPRLSTEPGPPGPSFRRSSCCLIYRLAPGRARPSAATASWLAAVNLPVQGGAVQGGAVQGGAGQGRGGTVSGIACGPLAARSAAASWLGGAPNRRRYSRLNWVGLS